MNTADRRDLDDTPAGIDSALLNRAFEGEAPSFLDDPDLLQRLNLIRHLIQSTRLAVLVSGPAGVGKSACLDELQRSMGQRWLLCRLAGATTRDPDRAMARLARCCDLPPDCGRPALRQLLAEHATVTNRSAQLPVIAVDDAHALEPDALREMVALTAAEHGWRLLLFAEPGHDAHWTAAGLGSAAQLHRLDWPPLSESQTGAYVLHRLRTAGWSGAQPLSAEQIRKLHRDSGGLPGRINQQAPALLSRQAPAPQPTSQPAPAPGPGNRRPLRWIGLAAVAATVALVLWQQDRINALFQQAAVEQATKPAATPGKLPEPPAFEPPPAARATADPPAQVGTDEPLQEPEPAMEPPEPQTEAATLPTPADEAAPTTQAAPAEEAAPETPPAMEPPAPQPEAPATAARDDTAEMRQDQADVGDPAPDPAAPPPPDATGTTPPAPETATPEPRPEVPEPAPEPTSPVEPETPDAEPAQVPAAASSDQGPAGEAWILARAPDHYTLQLLGSRELEPVLALIRKYDLDTDTAWYRIQYQGADWYVLVHGDFADSRAASRALAQLPAGLRRAGPWPRPMAAIQDEVRRGRK